MAEKIIFLDIDGPMIPYTSYLFDRFASWKQVLDDTCVQVLHKIIEASGAKIVFNTTHNRMLYAETEGVLKYAKPKGQHDTPGLIKRFEDAGFKDHIHPTICTIYPDTDRLTAINRWLQEHKTPDLLWVALDDVEIDHKRAFLVDPTHGIGLDAYNHCAKYFVYKPFLCL